VRGAPGSEWSALHRVTSEGNADFQDRRGARIDLMAGITGLRIRQREQDCVSEGENGEDGNRQPTCSLPVELPQPLKIANGENRAARWKQ
jgi:hypothetical protein